MRIKLGGAIIIVFLCLFLLVQSTSAEAFPVNAYFFYGDGCPHCGVEKEFLHDVLQDEYPNLTIYEYEIYNNRENALLLQNIAKQLELKIEGVPFLIIGDESFVGWSNTITPALLREKVYECSIIECPDIVAQIAGITPEIQLEPEIPETVDPELEKEADSELEKDKKMITLPFFGTVDALSFSLPVLTIIIGALDGFNPCAMWVLLFLISLLLGMEDRKRMWILGGTFIVASAFVYFLFMIAWLNLIIFLGFVTWIRIIIGLVALGGGSYSIKEFLFNKINGCKVAGASKKQKIFEKMKAAVGRKSLWLALVGIIALAFAVNLIELVCSAGLPAIYTQVLALNVMPPWQYYMYILLYIFFFMLDDLFVFFVTMKTLQMTGITTKYTKAARLIGGTIMIAIGLMLIFRPEWLMFG
jgi:glutaredoxin